VAREIIPILSYHDFSLEYNILPYILLLIGAIILAAGVLFILWKKADWLVRLVAGNINDNDLVIKTSNLDLFNVIMRAFGVFLLVSSIPALVGLIGQHIHLNQIYQNDLTNQYTFTGQYISHGLKIIIGLFLIQGTERISKMMDKVYIFLVKPEPENDEE
jgi:hypothetical protein